MSPTRNVTRRSFLLTALPVLGSLSLLGGLAGLAGCAAPTEAELAGRLSASLRSLLAGAAPAGPFAAVAMDRAQAVATLRGDLSPRSLQALTWSDALLRRYLAGRRRRDLRGGRTRFVDGWLVAESEVAVARLLGS